MKLCECGCGEEVSSTTIRYIQGHNSKKIKIKVYCEHCNKEIYRPISWVGKLNFCCSEHFHLYKKNERKEAVHCLNCNSQFYQYKTYLDRRQFCCDSCKDEWFKNNTSPIYCKMCNKPLFEDSFRKELSIFCGEDCRKQWKIENNIGEKVEVECPVCGVKTTRFKIHLSRDNFCNKKCQRIHMENTGKWVPENLKDDWEIYNERASFSRNVRKFYSEEEKILLEKKGSFSRKNGGGLVRDHIYSRRKGFDARVFAEIVRHPVNCRLITSVQNVARHWKNDLPEECISLDYLFSKIKSFNQKWKEQKTCLNLILLYENGERWKR